MFRIFVLKTIVALSPMVKVAVIDTGFDTKSRWSHVEPLLCNNGTYNFFTNTTDVTDTNSHGTFVTGLISMHAAKSNYCLYIYKAVDNNIDSTETTLRAFERAIYEKVDIINYSAGGLYYSKKECDVIKLALSKGIKVVAAAGNNGRDLKYSAFYPAKCDNRITVVVNIERANILHITSNYSTSSKYPTVKEIGTDILGIAPNGEYTVKTGTSMSTAIVTGKLVKKLWIEKINVDLNK